MQQAAPYIRQAAPYIWQAAPYPERAALEEDNRVEETVGDVDHRHVKGVVARCTLAARPEQVGVALHHCCWFLRRTLFVGTLGCFPLRCEVCPIGPINNMPYRSYY